MAGGRHAEGRGEQEDGGDDIGAVCAEVPSTGGSYDPGVPRMTPDVLKAMCLREGGYEDPTLNYILQLQHKGFRTIEKSLYAYSDLRTLFLESNGLVRLENLAGLQSLVSLYLQNNCIRRIENLHDLPQLKYINLAHNSISVIENLEHLPSLETINLSRNKLTEISALEGLASRPTLRSVDVSSNYVEDGDALLDFWPRALPDLQCLYLKDNPCWRGLRDLRRRLVSSLPQLRWLDERPIWTQERVGCEAWARGGKEAEQEALRTHILAEREAKAKSFNAFRRMQEAAAARVRGQIEDFAAREAAADAATSEELAAPEAAADAATSEEFAVREAAADAATLEEFTAREAAVDAATSEEFAAREAVAAAATLDFGSLD